jgi:hypothetical protein
MTPKEKAKELYDKFYMAIPNNEMGLDNEASIQCALIAVDEILKAVNNPDETYLMKHSVNYWTEVKQETEKL